MQALHSVSPSTPVSLVHHGDSYNEDFVSGLPAATSSFLSKRTYRSLPSAATHTSISVCHSEPGAWNLPPSHPRRYSTAQCPEPSARYTVGRTMFETDRLPTGWADRLNLMDEVWVPSPFMLRVSLAAGVLASKLHLLSQPVDAAGEFSPPNGASSAAQQPLLPPRACSSPGSRGSSAQCPYRFLSVGKWERRKGFDILLSAYLHAFSAAAAAPSAPPPSVELYILTSSSHGTQDFEAELARMLHTELACSAAAAAAALPAGLCIEQHLLQAPLPAIRLLTGVPQTALPGVYHSIDALVQPSRGEGWGRPHCEAMAMGKPLVATNWSGSTAFMTESNSFPLGIGPSLAAVQEGAFKGHLMAEPSAQQLAGILRELAGEGGARGEAVGRRAREDMLSKYSFQAVGAELLGLLQRAKGRAEAREAERGEERQQQHQQQQEL
jgi:glycosyltransferase involved in cell wall biosynthesis